MDILQRAQPIDILFAILWAGIVGWGLQTGMVRQVGMLIGLYAAAILAGSLYRPGGQALALVFGREYLTQLEFAAYTFLLVVTFGVVGLLIWRAYPLSRLSRDFGTDNAIGGAIGAIWGVLLLIAVLTILRYYTVTPWKGQEATQQGVRGQIQLSQVAPVLEVVAAPLWQVMTPWFPASVNPRL